MKLIDVLINGNWIWHDDDECVTQDSGGEICAWGVGGVFFDSEWEHPSKEGLNRYLCGNNAMEISTDYSSAIITKYQYQSALASSQKVEWSGDGLPPVGVEFEYGTHRTKAKCIGIGHHMIFASKGNPDDEESDYEEFMISILDSEFHQLRSEVDKKRDEAAKEMARHANDDENRGFDAGLRNCLSIYDAIASGKIPGVKLED